MRRELDSPSFAVWVDLFRWMAAFSVLISHAGLRMMMFVSDIPHPSVPQLGYAFLAGFDHYAVMVFFVLSGLLVGGTLTREFRTTGTVDVGRYVSRRVVRLCVVLWPSFLFSAVCLVAATALADRPGGPPHSDVSASLSLPVLLCNVAFLQTAACEQYAQNGALWSLFNEFWYYVLFPPLMLGLMAPVGVASRMALVALAVAVLAGLTLVQFTGSAIGPYMLIWLMGVAAATAKRPLMSSPLLAGLLLGAVLLAIRLLVRKTFVTDHPFGYAALDFLVSALFTNLLVSMKCARSLAYPPLAMLHRQLAGFSFSLYATHIATLVLYMAVLTQLTGTAWPVGAMGAGAWAMVLGALAASVVVGWGFSQLTEVHTDRVRRWVTHRVAAFQA